MKKIIVSFLFLTITSFSLVAQELLEQDPIIKDKGSYRKNFNEGNLSEGDLEYDVALKYYLYAYKYDSTNANINFKIGFCYLKNATQKHLAEKYLEKAILDVVKRYSADDPGFKKAPYMAYFCLGQSYHFDGRLDDAAKMYSTYESFITPKDKEEHDLIQHFKRQVLNAQQILAAPLNVTIKNLGDSINSEYPEYSPVITADEQVLYYTTRRPTTMGGERASDGMYYEDIVVSYKDANGKWSRPTSISPFINTNGHEATVSLTPDGQTLIIYRGDVGNGDLFYSSFDGKDWTIPQKYGSNINTEYWETHACLSRDGYTLYFVSDRPGGLGGRDIYKCVKLPNGQWSLATNVGAPINTPYDEDCPFLGADGVTFYFSSTGDKSMGGFDIMFSILDEGKFSEPFNMGSPINTTDDDVFYVATPDNKRFYLSSAHEFFGKTDIHGKSFGDKDIYVGSVDIIKENPLVLFRGRFVPGPCDSLPDDLSVIVSSVSSGEIVGTYRPQRRTGTFSIIIPPGSKYNFSYEQNGQVLLNEEVFVPADIAYEEIQKAINLKPLRTCAGMIVDSDSSKSKISLNVLVLNNSREKKHVAKADIKIVSKGVADYNLKSDEDGRQNGVELQAEKSYQITASANGSSGKTIVFNTIGVKGAKVYDKTVYVEKNPEDDISLTLNITVLTNKKEHKPSDGATIKVIGTDGSLFEGVADTKGKIAPINLIPETNYEIISTKDGKTNRAVVSTNGIRKSKMIDKTVYVQGPSEVPDNSEFSGDCFTFYFKYNMNEVDESAPEYKAFIDKLVAFKTGGGQLVLNVKGSASTVPTRKYKNNDEIAKLRANQTIVKLKNSLKQRGIAEADVTIATVKTVVAGPAYKGDAQSNASEYEKYQFVKICLAK
ncbi:MAG: TolB family protein [Bacteroidia bacterium]